jgi:hypothetical protein
MDTIGKSRTVESGRVGKDGQSVKSWILSAKVSDLPSRVAAGEKVVVSLLRMTPGRVQISPARVGGAAFFNVSASTSQIKITQHDDMPQGDVRVQWSGW